MPVCAVLCFVLLLDPMPGQAQTEYDFPPRVLEHLPEWAPGPEVLASVGRQDGDPEHLIGLLVNPALLSDGKLGFGDYLGDVIRVYGPDGAHRFDRVVTGEGPGEFPFGAGGIELSSTPSGGLLAWSQSQRRAYVYGPQGELESELHLREFTRPPKLLGLSGDGSFIVTVHSLDQAPLTPGEARFDSTIVIEIDPGSGDRTEWLRLPNPSYFASGLQLRGVRAVIPGPSVLPRALLAASPDGALIRGTSDRWQFEWWTPRGGVSHRVAFGFPEQAVGDSDREQMVATLAGAGATGPGEEPPTTEQRSLERSARRLVEGIERGETVAGFSVYSGGEIVVGAPRRPGRPPEPLLLSARGRPLGWLVNDPDEHGRYPTVMDIRGDRILLRFQDPDTDVVHLEIRPFGPQPVTAPPGRVNGEPAPRHRQEPRTFARHEPG